jgi:hypothetical protein
MANQNLLTAPSLGPLCIDCLAKLGVLEELLEAHDVESRVDTCVGCKRATLATYRFHRVHRPAA